MYGDLNGHSIGIVMKEMVRRAIMAIRSQRFVFEAQDKLGPDGRMDDVVTSADKAAQQVYLRSLQECFPLYGIVAEENNFTIPCRLVDCNIFFTVDPLDGTKAFVRGQSHGVGTMISLVEDGKVIAAFIGDINTQEIFGFRPGSDKAHRINDFDIVTQLKIDPDRTLKDQYALIRDPIVEYSDSVSRFLTRAESYQIADGSIGIMMARLWKGEVGAVILKPGYQTPWDLAPMVGISHQLGFRFFNIKDSQNRSDFLEETYLDIGSEGITNDNELLVIHDSRFSEAHQMLLATSY